MFSVKRNFSTRMKYLELQFESLLIGKFFNENEISLCYMKFEIDYRKFHNKDH